MENENIEQRLSILFAKEENELDKEDSVINDNLQDDYLSVNEGLTTDTDATTDNEHLSMEKRGSEKAAQGELQKSSEEDAGIASSDQDVAETPSGEPSK